jgi:hypothetical protein
MKPTPPQGKHRARRHDKTGKLRQLDRLDVAKTKKAENGRHINRQRRVKVIKRVAVAIIGVRHPTHRKMAVAQRRFQLLQPLQQKRAVAAAPRVHQTRPGKQRPGSQHGYHQCSQQ